MRYAIVFSLLIVPLIAGCGGTDRVRSRGTTLSTPSTSSTSISRAATAPTSTAPPGTTSTLAPSSTVVPVAGRYVDGPSSEPHYSIDLTTSTASSLSGMLSFQYQDGRSQMIFSFSGVPGNGQARLTTTGTPSTITVTYSEQTIDVTYCSQYLQYAASTPSPCSFSYAGPIPG